MSEKEIVDNVKKLQKINQQLSREKATFGQTGDTTRFRKKIDEDITEGNEIFHSLDNIQTRYRNDSQAASNVQKLLRQVAQETERYQQLSNEIDGKKRNFQPTFVADEVDNNNNSEDATKTQTQEFAAVGLVAINTSINEKEKRLQQVQNIASDVVELKEAFDDLNTLVNDQQGNINQIQANVETTKNQVESGTVELKKAEEHQKSYRRKQCYVLICVLIICGIIAGVLGGVLPSKK